MDNSRSDSYKQAGVDVTAGYRAVELMKKHIERTRTPGVLSTLGGFAGLFAPDLTGIDEPVLVSGTDGVGTKLKLAFALDRHDTIGIDCVAMCVNDILCSFATPLFFLDYIATPKNVPEQIEQIVAGVCEGCVQAGCALIGGETAEMPGFYTPGEYDIAGFCVGVADKKQLPDPTRVQVGDALIGLPSSGFHSNGFSLVRKLIADHNLSLETTVPGLDGTLGDVLLTPTRIYASEVKALRAAADVRSLCHITGGGFYENIPRALPQGLGVRVDTAAIPHNPIFGYFQKLGNIPARDMYNTFNMGLGMLAIVPPADAQAALAAVPDAFALGTVTASGAVELV